MEKIVDHLKAFYNNLRCPLCKGQLDGTINNLKGDLYCVTSPNEYRCVYSSNRLDAPHYEQFNYFYDAWHYRLEISVQDDRYYSKLSKFDMTFDEFFRERSRKKILEVKAKIPFFPKNLDEKQFLKKIKLYLTFV